MRENSNQLSNIRPEKFIVITRTRAVFEDRREGCQILPFGSLYPAIFFPSFWAGIAESV